MLCPPFGEGLSDGTHETMLSPGLVGQVATHILDYLRQEGLL